MQSDPVLVLPWWLVVGVLVGLATGIVIAGIFLIGSRLFPDDERAERSVNGTSRKSAEIRHYLRAIGEEFVEDYDLNGQPVAFYLPQRDVAITFDARAYFRIEATDTYAVLVEHEMPSVHLGRRLPFETPELIPRGDDGAIAAFALLGLETDATATEIRSAYREKVKRVHPDQGGDPETFRRVRDAYATAHAHATGREDEATAPATS